MNAHPEIAPRKAALRALYRIIVLEIAAWLFAIAVGVFALDNAQLAAILIAVTIPFFAGAIVFHPDMFCPRCKYPLFIRKSKEFLPDFTIPILHAKHCSSCGLDLTVKYKPE
ncbi:MAG: hypothetical protein H6875_10825 [Hyphomicrobiaceae bacterium]|nr:hypothetical protein [Hyphomicrobiaceae bacterium]